VTKLYNKAVHVFNPLNAELNPICHLLALLGAHHILHVSRIRVKYWHYMKMSRDKWWKQVGVFCILNYSNLFVKNLNTYLLTYLLTPWNSVLENLTSFQLVKKFPTFYGTRRFITALTSVRHLSLS